MKTIAYRWLFLASLAIVPAQAADTNPPPRLTVELRDGSRVVGESVGNNLEFHSSLLGEIKLAVKNIRVVECTGTNTAKLLTVNADALTVRLVTDPLALKTGFGKIELPAASLRKISVSPSFTAGAHPAGLVALWPGEDDGRDAVGGHDLILTDITFADGQVGRAFVMNGFGSCMKIAGPADFDPGHGDGLTMSAWIKPNDNSGFHPILEWNPSDKMPGVIGVQLWIGNVPGSQGVIAAHFVDVTGKPHSLISPPRAVATGKFQHVAATYDKTSGAGALYINGVVVARGQWDSFTPLTTGDFWISRRPTDHPGDWTYNTFFSGLLDEIAIYNRALSAGEIMDMAVAENHGDPLPPPKSYPSAPVNPIFFN